MKKIWLTVLLTLLVFGLGMRGRYESPSTSLIAHYKLNDNTTSATVVDSTGNHVGEYQIDGVAQNTDTGDSAGKINGALAFITADVEHINITDHADFTPALTPFSISVWVKMTEATNFPIMSKWATDHYEWELITLGTDMLRCTLYSELDEAVYIGRLHFSVGGLGSYEGSWIHLVFTYDGGITCASCKLYLNGVRVDNTDYKAGTFVSITDGDAPVYICRTCDVSGEGFIDNVMFFNTELTSSQVSYLYNSGRGIETLDMRMLRGRYKK